MYKFVDTVAGSASSSPMSLQTIFNGINLDNELTDEDGSFVTLSVSGRGLLNKRISYINTPNRHGRKEKSYTYDIREIRVKFKFEDKTNEGFRDRFNQLSFIMAQAQSKLNFTDESAYFWATLEQIDLPEEDSNSLIGTLVFICSDPGKYMDTKQNQLTSTFSAVNSYSHDETSWKTSTTFTGASNSFTLEHREKGKLMLNHAFKVNDIIEIDHKKRLVMLNRQPRMDLVSLDSNWFTLVPGANQLRSSHATTIAHDTVYY